MTRHRKDRGFRTERVVAAYLSQWWRSASVGRGAGKDITNVPFDVEVKARSAFQPLEWLRQATKRADGKELPFVVCRMNGQGEDASEYLAFMRFWCTAWPMPAKTSWWAITRTSRLKASPGPLR